MNLYTFQNRSIPFKLSDYDALVCRLEHDLKASGIVVRKKRLLFEIVLIGTILGATAYNAYTNYYKEKDKKKQEKDIAEKNKKMTQKLIESQAKVDNLKKKLDIMSEEVDKVKHELENNQKIINANNKELQKNKKIIEQNYKNLIKNAKELESFDHQLDSEYKISLKNFKKINSNLDNVFTFIDLTRNNIVNDIKSTQSEILSVIYHKEIDPVVIHLNSFIQYFLSESKRLTTYPIRQRMDKLEKKNGLLHFLNKVGDPSENGDLSLHFMLEKIIQRGWALPKDENDKSAENILTLLVYGTQIYSMIGMFVVQQHLFLANIYQLKGDLDMFNNHYEKVLNSIGHFSTNLFAKHDNNENSGIVYQVIDLLKKVIFQDFSSEAIENYAADSSNSLKEILKNFVKIGKLFSNVKPSFSPSIRFPSSNSPEPFILVNSTQLEWASAKKVYYALQYLDIQSKSSSLISDWKGATVTHFAGPIVSDIPQSEGKLRVIYRKIDDGIPQVVAVLKNDNIGSFRDINRDLFNAVFQLNEEKALKGLEVYIAAGADVNASFDNDKRPLYVALENGSRKVVKRLLKAGAEVNFSDKNGHSPLYIATQFGYADIVRTMIILGADLNVQTNIAYQRLTPLHSAVLKNFTIIADSLVSSLSVNLNAKMSDGSTALHLAASLNRVEILKTLFHYSANRTINFNAQNAKNYTALHLAVLGNATNSVEFLLKSTFSKNTIDVNSRSAGNMITPLHLAAMYGRSKSASMLLSRGADVTVLTANHSSVLHFAAQSGMSNLIQKLAFANPELCNGVNSFEITPLYAALRFNHTETAMALLKNCARIDIRLRGGKTMLHLAAQYGHTLVINNFFQTNISVDVVDERNFTPLHYAVLNNNLKIAKILLKKGANVNFANNEGQTPLHMIVFNSDEQSALQAAQMLVFEFNADLNAQTRVIEGERSKMTVLHWAAQLDYRSLASFLVNNGARVNATNNLKETPLHLAANFGHHLMTHFLINSLNTTEHVDALTTRQQTALHLACVAGHFNLSQILILEGKASVNVLDRNNRSSLMHLVKSKSCTTDMYDWFVSKKANVLAKDSAGMTLFYYAVARNYTKIAEKSLSASNKLESNYKDDPVFVSEPQTGHTPIYHAFKANNNKAVQFITNRAEKYSKKDGKSYLLNLKEINGMSSVFGFMVGNATWNDIKKNFLQEKPYIDLFFKFKPIAVAAMHNKLDLLKEFESETQYKKNFAEDVFNGLSAIHYAARNGNLQMLMYLKNKGVSIDSLDSNGNTPLFHAIEGKGDLKIVEFLFKTNAKLLKENAKKNLTIIDIAVKTNKTEIVQYLMSQNVTLKSVDVNKLTPLHISASLNNLKLVNIFLNNKNYDVNAQDNLGQTPLYKAIDNAGQLNLIKFLVKNGANIKKFNNKNSSSYIHQAIIRKKYEIAEYLINKNSNINSANYIGETPLYDAVRQGSVKIVKLLLNKGAYLLINKHKTSSPFEIVLNAQKNKNFNDETILNFFAFFYKSKKGKRLIHEMASAGKLEAVRFLLERGVYVNIRDNFMRTPLHFAAQNGELSTVKLLSKQKCFDVHAKDVNNKTAYDLADINSRQEVKEYLEFFTHSSKKMSQKISNVFDKHSFTKKFYNLQFNTNHSLFLADVILKKITGQKYILPQKTFIFSKQARVFALNIYDAFQEMMEQTSIKYKIDLTTIDSFSFYQELESILLNGKLDKIEEKLVEKAIQMMPKNFIIKQKKLKEILLNNIDNVLNKLPEKIGHWQIEY